MKKLMVFIMLATIPFLLGFSGIGIPEVIVILVILGIIGLPTLIIILIINAKKEGVPAQSVQTRRFCSNCGKEIAPSAYVCLGCGVKLAQESGANKDKLVAALLAIFLGGFGVHKFYLGSIGLGILYLLFCWTFIPSMIGFIEGIIYLTTDEAKWSQKYKLS